MPTDDDTTIDNETPGVALMKVIARGHVATASEMRAAFDAALAFAEKNPEPVGGWVTVTNGDATIRVWWHNEGQGPIVIADMRIRRDYGVL